MSADDAKINVTPYQHYLDREATIMGVLSAFGVGVAALVIKEVLPVEKGNELFVSTRKDVGFIVIGSALFVMAAGAFYWQRANLLWHYGQLALWATNEETSGRSVQEILEENDRWATWIPYQIGLVLVAAGFVQYAGAFVPGAALEPVANRLPFELSAETWYIATVLVISLCAIASILVVRLHRDLLDLAGRPARRGHARDDADVPPRTRRRLGRSPMKGRNERVSPTGPSL